MDRNEFNPEQEESRLSTLIDNVGQGKESARYLLGQELCSLSQPNLETLVKDWHKTSDLSAVRDGNGKIIALNFPYVDSDMFAQVNTCGDKRLPNGNTVEENPGTRITRDANGLGITVERTEGQFKGFKAEYEVEIDDNGLPKDAKVTSKWPNGTSESNTVTKEDFDSILFGRGDTVEFFNANGKWESYLQTHY
jgi:hypothetical protein